MRSPELALELRAARPVASPELRERVLAVAARPTPALRRFAFPSFRRLALVAAPAALALAVGGALVHGLVSSSPAEQRVSKEAPATVSGGGGDRQGSSVIPRALRAAKEPFSAVPNTPVRLQRYGASLRVQVKTLDALSDSTKRAMRVARLLGGYVAYIRYSAPAHGRGSASLVVRVPVDRVQDAIEEYSDLGTILAQRVTVLDVTKRVAEQAKEIARLRTEIAKLETGGVTPAERPRLELLKARLEHLTKRRAATVRRAELARISLVLTTKPKHAASSSRFDRTMSDAGGVLLREAEILLYALIVAGPLLLLGAAIIASSRYRDRRLFERS
jgi:hypothetical protein